MTMPKFTREQLFFVFDKMFSAVLDQIDGTLPNTTDDLEDWRLNEAYRRAYIEGNCGTVAAFVPIFYAQLTGDGLGIGDFEEHAEFEKMVDDFIGRKLDPTQYGWVSVPDTDELVNSIIDSLFADYLK